MVRVSSPRRLVQHLASLLLVTLACPTLARAEADVHFRGLLDMGLVSSVQGRALNQLTFGDSNLDPYRLRLFMDARLSPTLEVHVQTILHEGSGALRAELRADGAYALWTPIPSRDLSLEAGKIPWPIGTYAPRTYSDKNALMGTPLMYQWRTGLLWNSPTANVDSLVAVAGRGQLSPRKLYVPLVDERWWDSGAAVIGSWAPFEFSAGVVQGSPSWPAPGADNTPGLSILGRVGVMPLPGVRVGVSGADGTWMPVSFERTLPTGKHLRDYHETSLMVDAEFATGPLEVRGEAIRRRWQTTTTGDLDATSGYLEGRWAFTNGTWLAVRGETLRFSDVTTASHVTRPWDDTVDRYEGVVGYRVTHDVRLKLGVQRTVRHPYAAARLTDDLLMASLGFKF